MSLLDPLVSAGLANAALLTSAAAAAAVRDRRWGWLAGFLLLSFLTLCAIVVQHRTDGRSETIAVAVEQIGWATGPLLYLFVRAGAGHRVSAREAMSHLALPALVLLAGTPLILLRGEEPLPAVLLVIYQGLYTLAAGWTFVTRPEAQDRSVLAFWAPLCAIATMAGIHAGQVLRSTSFGRPLADAVPIVGSIAILAALLALLTLPGVIGRSAARYSRSGLKRDEAVALFETTRTHLIAERLFTRHDLSLGDMAAAMLVSPHRLSQAISEGGATSFSGLVAGLRVDEACRLLREPRNATVALEPIGMEAGFRSRSAFYSGFKALTGLTPGEYREREIVSGPIGQDSSIRDGMPFAS